MWFLSDTCPNFSYTEPPRNIHDLLESLAGSNNGSLSHYFVLRVNDPENAQQMLAEILTRELSEFTQFSKLGHPQWMDIKELGGEKAVRMAEEWLEARKSYDITRAEILFRNLGALLAECAHYALAQAGMQSEINGMSVMVQHKIDALMQDQASHVHDSTHRFSNSYF